MTPPSIESAVELLTSAASRARTSGDPVAELAAAAIDVVLARMARARRIEDDLVSWRADVEAATLDHGWMITGHIDALLAPLVAAQDPTATEPQPPVPAARLREIAAGEYGPNRQEGKAMAAELLAVRAGLARLHRDLERWLTESDDRPNLRAAENRVRWLQTAAPPPRKPDGSR